MITNILTQWKMPSFGLCWEHQQCKGRLYPAEIKPYVPEELYNEYRQKFNWKFRAVRGGSIQRRSGQRKTIRKVGGAPRNIIKEATNAKCSLPPKKTNVTRKNY